MEDFLVGKPVWSTEGLEIWVLRLCLFLLFFKSREESTRVRMREQAGGGAEGEGVRRRLAGRR